MKLRKLNFAAVCQCQCQSLIMEVKRSNSVSLARRLRGAGHLLGHVGNALVFAAVAVLTLALRAGFVPPVRRGFQCGDMSIALPLKPETVSTNVLLFGGLLVALATILATNFAAKGLLEGGCAGCCPCPGWLSASGRHFFLFLLGLASTVMLTEMGKLSSGILRPNFLAMCAPNVSCASEPPHKYQNSYACTGSPEDDLDSRLSFPSGHATVVSFMAVFLMVYLHWSRTPSTGFYLLRPLLQLLLFAVAYVTCLTRISDYVHHASDVVVGVLLGGGVAAFTMHALVGPGWRLRRRRGSRDTPGALEDPVGDENSSANSMKITLNHNHEMESKSSKGAGGRSAIGGRREDEQDELRMP